MTRKVLNDTFTKKCLKIVGTYFVSLISDLIWSILEKIIHLIERTFED